MTSNELADACQSLVDTYHKLKTFIRRKSPYLYERWKAGGFRVDECVNSMYPSIAEVVNSLCEEMEEGEDDDE